MSSIFLHLLNISISAGYLVAAVLLLRLLLKKAPKWVTVLLWGVVGVRLVFPFTIESVLSLLPSAQPVSPTIMTDPTPTVNTGVPIVNNAVNPMLQGTVAPVPSDSANPLQIWVPILATVWLIGVLGMLIYATVSYLRIKCKIGTAVRLRDNIYQSERVAAPFVLGIVHPKIYLPFSLNEKNAAHVIAHEQAHIRRRDHWWKPLGFLLLAIYWFNPLLWVGYVLLSRDIEMACDEKVIKSLDHDARADYSEALLACSVGRRAISACPLAFGEVGVKARIKSVLNYKKPAFWIIVVALLACVAVAVCFLTVPSADDEPHTDNTDQSTEASTEALTTNPEIPASEGLAYEINTLGGFCTITGIGSCTDTEIRIPREIEGYPVFNIADSAFTGCRRITSVTISDSVKYIGNNTFRNCTRLTSIVLGENLLQIGNTAFVGCKSLTTITIPESVTDIGDAVFNQCDNLTDVYVTNVQAWLNIDFFGKLNHPNEYGTLHLLDENGAEITDLVIPEGVTSIGNFLFANCKSLRSVTIPASVTTIGWDAFDRCENLTVIYYTGSQNDWNTIAIERNNAVLQNATIFYNYKP